MISVNSFYMDMRIKLQYGPDFAYAEYAYAV